MMCTCDCASPIICRERQLAGKCRTCAYTHPDEKVSPLEALKGLLWSVMHDLAWAENQPYQRLVYASIRRAYIAAGIPECEPSRITAYLDRNPGPAGMHGYD